ncbi:MAG: hypothetical protein ACJ8FY_19375 [Gemmataceae bacterium]
MLSQKTLEAYRRMTPGQRLTLTLNAMRESLPYLLRGTEDVVKRRFARIRQENDERNQALLTKLAAAERES